MTRQELVGFNVSTGDHGGAPCQLIEFLQKFLEISCCFFVRKSFSPPVILNVCILFKFHPMHTNAQGLVIYSCRGGWSASKNAVNTSL